MIERRISKDAGVKNRYQVKGRENMSLFSKYIL